MNFFQLLRGDADEARKQLKSLVSKTVPVTQVSMESQPGGPLRLKFVAGNAYGTETYALLDTVAVPNLMSWEFWRMLALAPISTGRQVTVAD